MLKAKSQNSENRLFAYTNIQNPRKSLIVLPWNKSVTVVLVYVLLSKSAIILQTATVCLHVFSISVTSETLFPWVNLPVTSHRSRHWKENLSKEKSVWMSVQKFFLYVDTRKGLRPIEIYVLQRSKPDVLQISNVSA